MLTTKVFHSTTGAPGDTGLAPDRIRRQLAASLERLGVDRVDLYLAHEPDPETPLADTIATFEALRERGADRRVGRSATTTPPASREALAPRRSPRCVQNSFSLLDRGDEARRAAVLRGARHRLRAVRPALGRLADRQVPPRGAVPRRLAHDAASRAVRAASSTTASSTGSTGCARRRTRAASTCRRSRSRGCSRPGVDGAVCGPTPAGAARPGARGARARALEKRTRPIGRFFA